MTKITNYGIMKIMGNGQATIQKRLVRGRAFQKVLAVMDRMNKKIRA